MVSRSPLSETHPEIAAQAFGWDPATVTSGSGRKLEWQCSEGHVWSATVGSRTNLKSGCSVCENRTILVGYNDLATTHPDIAAEAFGWNPKTVVGGTLQKREWQCGEGHVWISSVLNRTGVNKRGCPFCSNRRLLFGYNDLATIQPELAAEAFEWDPTRVINGSAKKFKWRCAKGHTWLASVDSRSGTRKTGCPICAGRQVLAGFNDLATLHPEISAQAYGWDPTTVTASSNKKLAWQCSKGHVWTVIVNGRTGQNKNNCSVCENRTILVGYNDLATTHPDIAAQADGLDPTNVVGGDNRKFKWRCDKGHTWTVGLNSRTGGKTGCPICSGHQVLAGYNDLATTHPELASEASGWDPTSLIAGSNKKRKWQCVDGHTWTTTVNNRTGGNQTGCPSCAKTGFDPNKEGWLYFLRHELWGLFQIGISNVPQQRLDRHGSRGWEVIDVRGPLAGEVTYEWEQSILRSLKRRGVALGPEEIAGRFSGYTEAWIQEDFHAVSISELMELVYADE